MIIYIIINNIKETIKHILYILFCKSISKTLKKWVLWQDLGPIPTQLCTILCTKILLVYLGFTLPTFKTNNWSVLKHQLLASSGYGWWLLILRSGVLILSPHTWLDKVAWLFTFGSTKCTKSKSSWKILWISVFDVKWPLLHIFGISIF